MGFRCPAGADLEKQERGQDDATKGEDEKLGDVDVRIAQRAAGVDAHAADDVGAQVEDAIAGRAVAWIRDIPRERGGRYWSLMRPFR